MGSGMGCRLWSGGVVVRMGCDVTLVGLGRGSGETGEVLHWEAGGA